MMMKLHYRSSIVASLIFILLLSGLFYWTHTNQTLQENEHQQMVRDVLIAEASGLERKLTRMLSATYILAQEVKRTQGKFPNFDTYADDVMSLIEGISNLQLAPGGIVSKIYPLEGNESALGHNILKDDARRKEALWAVREKRLTLAGPFTLLQGGVGIIGRNPVFINTDPDDQGESSFWGFVSVLIYLEDLLASTNLAKLEKQGYSFQITRMHPDTDAVDVFFRSTADLVEGHVMSHVITVPNSSWTLSVSRAHQKNHLFGYIFSFFTALLLSYLLYKLLLLPEKLRMKVEEKTAQLQELAFHDPLTGLANRWLLNEQLDHEIHNTLREKTKSALMYIDLDDFKRINDSLGHDSGDKLLEVIARRLLKALRKSDIVARLGGDEFAVVLSNIGSLDQVQRFADNLIQIIQKPVQLKNSELIVSATIGITIIPDDGLDVGTLLSNADLAMYAAKREGKCKGQFFDKNMQKIADQHLLLEQDLRKALVSDELFLVYQPLICFSEEKVKGFEALIRWQHPTMGLLSPFDFIPVAETTGLVVPLGYWVIEKACELISHRKELGLPEVYIAVNLAAQQFSDPNIVSKISAILSQSNVDPSLIELEITETGLMDNFDIALESLAQLKAIGITIAIDDFGTGYSSLSHLKNLPVDTLKIDRSFINEIAEAGSGDQKIVETILAMASKLELKVVAEGIETHGQLVFLQSQGCNVGQGYLFDKPVSQEVTDDYPMDLAEILGTGK